MLQSTEAYDAHLVREISLGPEGKFFRAMEKVFRAKGIFFRAEGKLLRFKGCGRSVLCHTAEDMLKVQVIVGVRMGSRRSGQT